MATGLRVLLNIREHCGSRPCGFHDAGDGNRKFENGGHYENMVEWLPLAMLLAFGQNGFRGTMGTRCIAPLSFTANNEHGADI